MKTLIRALVLTVFATNCWLAWCMLTLMLQIRNAGRVLPFFTNLCILLRPLLLVLPIAAAAYCVWLWLRKTENTPQWAAFLATTLTTLLLFAFPAILTCYWLLIDPVRLATGVR